MEPTQPQPNRGERDGDVVRRYTPPRTRWVIRHVLVKDVREEFSVAYDVKEKRLEKIRGPSLGWFVHLEGSFESLNFGTKRPDIRPGDYMRISLEKDTPPDAPNNG